MPPPLTPAALAERLHDATGTIAVAVSGGPDSLALLWLAAHALPGRMTALTVDHGLRAEAAQEARLAARCAAELGVPHRLLRLEAPPGPANLQADARAARYAAMAGACRALGIATLLTAHHADDQAETLLLRLARGSGLGGLAGVRARATIAGVEVRRPLLDWGRADLARVVDEAGWLAADDPSNRDPRFGRTGARALLSATPWLRPERLAASAAHLAEAEAALEWAAARAWESRATRDEAGVTLDPEALPAELRRRLLLASLAAMGVAAPDGAQVARLQARLEAGGTATLGGLKARALPDARWRLSRAAPRARPS
jgi:tRNA(Ile)-lysidine synthase